MSIAGTRSTQGDEYQLRIALHWLIRLLSDNSINAIQAESSGVPGEDFRVTVDDVVVLYVDGRASFVQAKKNQPNFHHWSLSDKVLQEELLKSRNQLESKDDSMVIFYSRSPFGELQKLVEGCRYYPDFTTFKRDAPNTLTQPLAELSGIIDRTEEQTFQLALRIDFGPTLGFDDWDRQNRADLDRVVPQVDKALPIFERFLGSHQSKLRNATQIITRTDVVAELSRHGIYPTPKRDETEILNAFSKASCIGRNWLRTIGGETIPREELSTLVNFIEQGSRTILLTDRPGSGKTCLLLDLVDYIEKEPLWGLLFMKGDQFTECTNETDLTDQGLPHDIVGQCARLAGFRKVVVVIDSLDVLSISRQHGVLKLFLGLIDRLEKVEELSIVVACRDFDLKYDPLLRGRKWQQTVTIGGLDHDRVVSPLLQRWGLDPDSLRPELRDLLQLPQNLRLFEKIAKHGSVAAPLTAYELNECYLEEIVEKDSLLGVHALNALQEVSLRLLKQRTQTFPRSSFPAEDSILQRLISQEVLFEPSPGTLGFTHQTIVENLIVRSELARGSGLVEFICDHPPLPFIRPTVRAFLFFLRARQPDVFRRQIRAVISDDRVAYHIKRLVAESLAEIIPTQEDWPFLRHLFRTQPDLFRRFFWRIEADSWFDFITLDWLPVAKNAPDNLSWLGQFVSLLKRWVNRYPERVVSLWHDALTLMPSNPENLIWEISDGLKKLDSLETSGVKELFTRLIEVSNSDHDLLGGALSRWVMATNSGDDQLWRYITKDIEVEDLTKWDLGDKLHCEPHKFHDEKFLAERLLQSDTLLTIALSGLERWCLAGKSYSTKHELRSAFLHKTSWEALHSHRDIDHVDALKILLYGIEDALKSQSQQNSVWWQNHELQFRASKEVSIRYFLIQAYQENIECNLSGIEVQLVDLTLLRYSHLEYELGELMQRAYPYLSDGVQLANQHAISSLYADEEWGDEGPPRWYFKKLYELYIWIPTIYRTSETQAFLINWQGSFGYTLPSAHIFSSGGTVGSPITPQALLGLSDEILLRFLRHYNSYTDWHECIDGGLVGGRDSITGVLSNASSRCPMRFIRILHIVIDEKLHSDYAYAIIGGVSDNLHFRFGNLRKPEDWVPIEPEVEGKTLAKTVLSLVEQNQIIQKNNWTISRALEACSYILLEEQETERIIFQIYRLLYTNGPSEDNTTHVTAAETAMLLANKLLENDLTLPELLPCLLRHFARNPVMNVRISILNRLPYLLCKRPDVGWQLLADIFREPQTVLWEHAEKCLYHQYHQHFELVNPYLIRISIEAPKDAGASWGRIAALASLEGHISQEQLFATLDSLPNKAWKGVTQVFRANLIHLNSADMCLNGLLKIMQRDDLPDEVYRLLDNCFEKEGGHVHANLEFVLAFLKFVPTTQRSHDMHGFFEWLGFKARNNPIEALGFAELLADKFELLEYPQRIWRTEPLVAALVEIMREADESDDQELIQRVIALQDRFLRLDIRGMNDLLEEAVRL